MACATMRRVESMIQSHMQGQGIMLILLNGVRILAIYASVTKTLLQCQTFFTQDSNCMWTLLVLIANALLQGLIVKSQLDIWLVFGRHAMLH